MDLSKKRRARVSENIVLNVLLYTQDNLQEVLEAKEYHLYKIKLVHELLEIWIAECSFMSRFMKFIIEM